MFLLSKVIWIEDRSEFNDLLETEDRLVVDFTAPGWCAPCQKLAPHFEAAAEASDDATFVAIDVDKADWAMVDYGVRGVPSVRLFRFGQHAADLKERVAPKLLAEIKTHP